MKSYKVTILEQSNEDLKRTKARMRDIERIKNDLEKEFNELIKREYQIRNFLFRLSDGMCI